MATRSRPAGAGQEVVRHVGEVGHAVHVEPALRGGDHEVSAAEAQGAQQAHPRLHVVAALAQQVLAGDAQVQLARVKPRGDVGGGEQAHLGAGQAAERGAIAALAALQRQGEAAVVQPRLALFLEPPLGGERQDEGLHIAHAPPPDQARQGRTMQPTDGPAAPPSRASRLSERPPAATGASPGRAALRTSNSAPL